MTRLRPLRRFLRADRGAVAVEFAAIVLPLALLLLGTVESARVIWTRHAIEDAAAVGARCVGLRGADCTTGEAVSLAAAAQLVRDQAAAWLVTLDEGSVTAIASGSCGGGTGFARISVRHEMTGLAVGLADLELDIEACYPVMPTE